MIIVQDSFVRAILSPLIASFSFFSAARDGMPVAAKYIHPHLCAAVAFEPARLDRSAKAAGLPVADLWKLIEQSMGVDILQFKRIIILVEPFPGGNVAFFPGFVLHYPAGADARKELTALLGGEVKETNTGKISYVRSAKHKLAKVEWAGYAIDERTILAAPWPTVEVTLRLRSVPDNDRILAAELAKADFDHDLTMIITPPSLMKRLKSIGVTEDPSYKQAKPILERLATISMTVDLAKDPVLRAECRCENEAGARIVYDGLKDLLPKVKEGYPKARESFQKTTPPEVVNLVLPLADQVVHNHNVTREGNKVLLTVARPKNWKK